MGRYVVWLADGRSREADDVRELGENVEYIARFDHVRVVVPRGEVARIEKTDLGLEGGLRFTGVLDRSFERTPGSA
jgi:hypothetical protein